MLNIITILLLSFASLAHHSSFLTTQERQSKVLEIHFNNYIFKEDRLFYRGIIDQVVYEDNSYTTARIDTLFELPATAAIQFKQSLHSSSILTIKSNKSACIDCIPFHIRYKTEDSTWNEIYAIPQGMSTAEKESFNSFHQQLRDLDYRGIINSLFALLPDGEYLYNRRMYWKENNIIKDLSTYPLVLMDGRPITTKQYKELIINKNDFHITTLESPQSSAIYGSRAEYGVIIISSK